MRFASLVAVFSIPVLGGFAPILTYPAAVEAARAACAKVVGKTIRTDLFWSGAAGGFFGKTQEAPWRLWAFKQGDNEGPGHWYFKVVLPVSGAGPNTCVANGILPASALVAPVPPAPKPHPLAPGHRA